MVDNESTATHNLLISTETGRYFLYHLLILNYPRLATTSLTTIDIPKFSSSNPDLYSYTNAIKNYIHVHAITNRVYSET